MRRALILSSALHLSLLATLLISLRTAAPLPDAPEIQALPVELVSIAPETTLTTGAPEAEALTEEPAEETVAAETPPPPEAPPGANDLEAEEVAVDEAAVRSPLRSASPLPEAVEAPQTEETEEVEAVEPSEPEPAPEETPSEPVEETPSEVAATTPETVVPARKPAPPQRTRTAALQRVEREAFDADRVSDLINRTASSGGGSGAVTAGAGVPDISGAAELTMDEKAYLRAKMHGCYVMPVGLRGSEEDVAVAVEIELNVEGNVEAVQLLNPRNNAVYKVAETAARRAVMSCQPYRLPAERFSAWRSIRYIFKPNQLL